MSRHDVDVPRVTHKTDLRGRERDGLTYSCQYAVKFVLLKPISAKALAHMAKRRIKPHDAEMLDRLSHNEVPQAPLYSLRLPEAQTFTCN